MNTDYENNAEIHISDLSGIADHDIAGSLMSVSWPDIVDMMSQHEVRKEKSGLCFIPAKFKPQDQWQLSEPAGGKRRFKPTYRNESNIEAISFAVLDLDVPGAKEKAEAIFKDFDYVLYSTHSYTKETPYKFRMVLRLEQPVPVKDWPQWFRALATSVGADPACGNLSRLYYYPSCSPTAGIKPYVAANKGKALTKEDMLTLETRFGTAARAFGMGDNDSPWWSKGEKQRHFSGGERLANERNVDGIDHSYEAYLARHQKIVDECLVGVGESRHNFALRAIGREFVQNKEGTNLFRLIQFIYRAAQEKSSKPLYQGDTPLELLEMIESAMSKFGVGERNEETRALITQLIQKAERCAITNRWSFPPPNTNKRSALADAAKPSYLEMRKNHLMALKGLQQNGDPVEFAKQVLRKESSISGMEIDISHSVQFVFRALAGMESSMGRGSNIRNSIHEYLGKMLSAKDDVVDGVTTNIAKPAAAFEFSARLAAQSAMGDRPWMIADSRPSNVQVSEAPGVSQ